MSRSNVVKIVALNCCGFDKKIQDPVFADFLAAYDIIFLSETKSHFAAISGTALDGHTALNSDLYADAKNLFAGHGIFVIVRDALVGKMTIKSGSSRNVMWVHAKPEVLGQEVIFGAVYIPPQGSKYLGDRDDVFGRIKADIADFKHRTGAALCMIGDFNARTGCLQDVHVRDEFFEVATGIDLLQDADDLPARANEDSVVAAHGRHLINLCLECNVCIANGRVGLDSGVGRFTCENRNGGRSAVDYAVMSPDLLPCVTDFEILDFCPILSDTHCPVTLSITSVLDVAQAEEQPPEQQGERLVWNDTTSAKFSEELGAVNEAEWLAEIAAADASPTPEAVSQLGTRLQQCLKEKAMAAGALKQTSQTSHATPRRSKPSSPWFDKDCEAARKRFYRAKNALKALVPEERRERLRAAGREYRRECKRKRSAYHRELDKKLRRLKSEDPKEYWRIINRATGRGKPEAKVDLDRFTTHFENLSAAGGDQEPAPDCHLPDAEPNDALNQDFTVEEILKRIAALKKGKAAGLSGIRNEFLKNCPREFVCIITAYFNLVLRTGFVPEEWCVGLIMPLFKGKGSRQDPDGYRGITLLCCLGKLFTSLINERLTKYLDSIGALGEEQAGFRAGYSTSDHIFALHTLIEMYQSRAKRLYVAFVDYKKAFDLVSRPALWAKLLAQGISGKILQVVVNIYQKAKATVRVNGTTSREFVCNIGVRQGENLSPLLFALFLNDFNAFIGARFDGLTTVMEDFMALHPEEVELFHQLFCLLYADDTLLLAESPQCLQVALNALHEYATTFHLTVNLDKTQIIVFSRGLITNDSLPAFMYGHDRVEVVKEYVYLGCTFRYDGKFTTTTSHLPGATGSTVEKQLVAAKRALNALLYRATRLQLPYDLVIDLFDKLVTPVLLYGSEVWGFSDLSKIEVFYRDFLRKLLGVGSATPCCLLYGETGTVPLQLTVLSRMVGLWLRIREGAESKIVSLLYKLSRSMHYSPRLAYRSAWISYLQEQFESLGMLDVWMSEGAGMSSSFISGTVKRRAQALNLEKWRRDIGQNAVAETYRSFKSTLEYEPYLDIVPYRNRRHMTRFRCRSNYLPIADFRRHRDPRVVPVCPLCGAPDCNEPHLLFRCPALAVERALWQRAAAPERGVTDEILLLQAFDAADVDGLRRLSSFIAGIMGLFDPTT